MRLLLSALVLFAGCSGVSNAPSSSVTGKVTLGGVPLSAGAVLFMTDDGNAASAELSLDGTYTLQCRPGRYKVAVSPPAPLDPLGAPASAPPPRTTASQQAIPKRYHDLGTSGLTVEVKEGANTFDIVMTR